VSAETSTGYAQGVGGKLWWKSVDPGNSAVPLVLLHGGPGSPSYYLEPLEALASDRRVVVYDQLGAGRSDAPDDSSLWTLETFVEDLRKMTNELGLERFHLLGHSWGGALALAYLDAHPGHVESLIMASPLVDVDKWVADADELVSTLPLPFQAALRGPADTVEYSAAEAEFYRHYFCNLDPYPEALQKSVDGLGLGPYVTMWGPNEFTCTGNLRGIDLSPVAAGLDIPNLWLCGSDDEARPATIRGFSESNPHGQFVEFAGGTHCVHLEQPDAYLAVLRDFLLDGVGS
jgi:proline-specific peptidase